METWRFKAKQIQWWSPEVVDYEQTRWTSFYDVGKEIGDAIFSYEEYLEVERKYIDLVKYSFRNQKDIDYACNSLEIKAEKSDLDNDSELFDLLMLLSTNKLERIDFRSLEVFIKLLLREYIWCDFLGNETLKFRFGYDYYVYIDGVITKELEQKIDELGLFVND